MGGGTGWRERAEATVDAGPHLADPLRVTGPMGGSLVAVDREPMEASAREALRAAVGEVEAPAGIEVRPGAGGGPVRPGPPGARRRRRPCLALGTRGRGGLRRVAARLGHPAVPETTPDCPVVVHPPPPADRVTGAGPPDGSAGQPLAAPESPWSRSAMMSSIDSSPTDSRTRPGLHSAGPLLLGGELGSGVVVDGWITRLRDVTDVGHVAVEGEGPRRSASPPRHHRRSRTPAPSRSPRPRPSSLPRSCHGDEARPA